MPEGIERKFAHNSGALEMNAVGMSAADLVLINLKNEGVENPLKHPDYVAAITAQIQYERGLQSGRDGVGGVDPTIKHEYTE